jgi:hypothetical protein
MMGSLTFTLKDLSLGAIKNLPVTVSQLRENHGYGAGHFWSRRGNIPLSVLPYVETPWYKCEEEEVYVMCDGQLVNTMQGSLSAKSPKKIIQRELKALYSGKQATPAIAGTLEDALIVVNVSVDSLGHISQSVRGANNTRTFFEEIGNAAETLRAQTGGRITFSSNTTVQVPLQKDTNAIYVLVDNCLTWFDSTNPKMDKMRTNLPAFYQRRIELLEQVVKK